MRREAAIEPSTPTRAAIKTAINTVGPETSRAWRAIHTVTIAREMAATWDTTILRRRDSGSIFMLWLPNQAEGDRCFTLTLALSLRERGSVDRIL